MRIVFLIILAFHRYFILAAITFKLEMKPDPTPEERAAYLAIEKAMTSAVKRYQKYVDVNTTITVKYMPGVKTADAAHDAREIRFGSHQEYWNERVALHEIAHILGVGWHAFDERCKKKTWTVATKVLRQFSKEKNDAEVHCGGGHFWPYGLNYPKEFSETNADRHCQMIKAMRDDGMH
ncbi:uncharacterized protein MELLADRAFT_36743 [Melampsora larici-populina 98AG31]|uniref:Secreted protein n=1 Tax=Melampsora larici-populina (strain 98AG31 / pathotype 3-4-7) TaxID=747676 RepID=F4RQ83_MELLP|nr:uncharacterized protein MELLADRAFT_36743 [Melampsora larici-populina 98AG31]EGG05360.1 secreted protein [Melampsora larici-populina 98AG31]